MNDRNQAEDGIRRSGESQEPNFTIVWFCPGDDPAGHLHMPGRRRSADFLCLDARKFGIDSVLTALAKITAYQGDHLDGFMPPCVVTADSGTVSCENMEHIAQRGAYLFETPSGCNADVCANQRLGQLFATNRSTIVASQATRIASQAPQAAAQTTPARELGTYTSWPEALSDSALAHLYNRATMPDSPLKDD